MSSGGRLGRVGAEEHAVRRMTVLGVGIAAAVGLAACGGGSTAGSANVGKISIAHGGSSYHYRGPGFSGSVSGGSVAVALPSDFPAGVPRPAGGVLVEATTTQAASGPNYNLIYRYPSANAASKALGAYDANLRSAGFSNNSSSSGSGTVLQGWKSADWGVSITVGPTGSSPASEMLVGVSPAG